MGWLTNKVQEITHQYLMSNLDSHLGAHMSRIMNELVKNIVKLDASSQYLLVVREDEVAEDLVEAMQRFLDPDKLPRIAVIVSKGVDIISIGSDKK